MTDTVLFETTVPRTLDTWVERFSQPQWRGAHVEGWLFEGVAARRAAEHKLLAAGVRATLRSAYKPLVHFFLEEIDCSALARVTVRYPVHPGAADRRFLLEAYPLAALLPGDMLEFVPGDADLHYHLTLTWNDGRQQQLSVFAPNRSHTGPSGADHLSPTGWLRASGEKIAAIDSAQQTEHEQVVQHVLRTVQEHAWPKAEPYFDRLDVRIDLAGIEQPLPLLQESISTHEALHEDIYFSLLEIFQRRSGRAAGDRRLQPGQIVPDIRAGDGDARLRIALRTFPRVAPPAAAADRAVPLDQMQTALEPARIAAEIDSLAGERFAATSRQGRTVVGVYHRGSAAPVVISGGQHANETSGIVGALRAASVLQGQANAHFALVALENPDGYALQRELVAHHPSHMHHAARYSALGDDIEFRTEPPLYERAAREQALALSGAQLHLNLHGYPAHEWTRPWSGYLPQGFELWTVPKGFFLVLRHHTGWHEEARALLEQVCATLAKVPGLADFNARQLALYQRHAGAPAFETIHGISCTVTAVDRPGAPVTLITEFPDETIHGEAFRFAHTVQMETVLAAARAWQALARRYPAPLRRDGGDTPGETPETLARSLHLSLLPSPPHSHGTPMNTRQVLLAAVLALAGNAYAQTKWDLPAAYPASNFHTVNLQQFANDVDKATGGKLKIQVHANASLFKAPEIKRAVQQGQAQIGEILLVNYQNEWQLFGVDGLPFLADSYDEAMKLYKAQKPVLDKKLGEQGMMLLYAVAWPPQGIYSKKPINSAADMKGLKWRAYSPATSRIAELVGAQPVTVQAAELSQAMATGVVDSYMSSGSTGYDTKTYEHIKNWYDTQAWLPKNTVLVNRVAFNALDKPSQDALLKAGAEAETRGWAASRAENDRTIGLLKQNGMSIIAPSAQLKADMKKVGDVMLKEWLEKAGPEGKAVVDAYQK